MKLTPNRRKHSKNGKRFYTSKDMAIIKTFSLWRFELFESIDLREREKKINRILGNIFDWEIHIFDRVVELYRLGSEVHWRWRGENVWKKILLTKKIMN